MNRIRDKPARYRSVNNRRRFLIKLLVLLTAAVCMNCFVFGFFPQHGSQLYPAVRDGDLLVTLRIRPAYLSGVLVGYRTPEGNRRIGRIVAVGGETVNITDHGQVEVNGLLLSENTFFPADIPTGCEITFPYTVPGGRFFILNDHRSEADDSRIYGAISRKQLLGSAVWLFRRRNF